MFVNLVSGVPLGILVLLVPAFEPSLAVRVYRIVKISIQKLNSKYTYHDTVIAQSMRTSQFLLKFVKFYKKHSYLDFNM